MLNWIEVFIDIKMDLALNNLQWLMCHKTKPNLTKPNQPSKLKNVFILVLWLKV